MSRRRVAVVGMCIVLLVGLPSTAVAVARIRSADIVNGAVRTPDLAKGAVTSAKVRNDSLKGTDINESSLGTVPEAARVGGLRMVKVFLDEDVSNSGSLLSMAGLRVRYSCNNPGELYVYAHAVEASDGRFSYYTYSGGPTGIAATGEEVEIASVALGNTANGHLQYFDSSGRVVTFDWTIESLDTCLFVGTAVGG